MKGISDSITPRYVAIAGIVLIMATLITGIPGSYGVSGNDPDSSQNLEIRTWYDLNAVRDNLSGNHTLMNDLDSATPGYTELAGPTANGGEGWQPIGYSTPAPASCKANPPIHHGLSGTLDGQGYEIRDLFINRPDESEVGLFAYLKVGGIIKNVGVVNCTLVAHTRIGSLVGLKEAGTIRNCYSICNVTGYADIGGLVGSNYRGNISNSYCAGSVSSEWSTGIGGLAGDQHSGATLNNCYSTCSVTGGTPGSGDIGGLIGDNYYIENVISSFWDMETSGQSTSGGGTGKNTTEMQDIATFSAAGWNIIAVALNETNPAYIWNIVNNVTYPFLNWQS